MVAAVHNEVCGLASHLFDIFVSSTMSCNEHSAPDPCFDKVNMNILYVQLVALEVPYKAILVRLKRKAKKKTR